jgi:pSer/pThr/pTyr-binding forkhead associated (FHA) protein
MDDPKPTQRLDVDDPELLESLLKQRTREMTTASLGKSREVLLLVENGIRRIELHNEISFLLGRFNSSKQRSNHIDLTPFGAGDKGVSRIHAQIHMDNDKVYIADMDSTNGTFVDGVRLQAHHPSQIRQGSEIMLGKLHLQIMYRSQDASSSD